MLTLIAVVLGACVAGSAEQPKVRPKATLELVYVPPTCKFMMEVTTMSGANFTIPLDLDAAGELARNLAYGKLVHANWLVERSGAFGIEIYGVRTKGGQSDPIKTLVVTARKVKGREIVKLDRAGDVKVELRDDDPKPGPKPPPVGPDLGDEPFVEFDFTKIPCEKAPWDVTIRVLTSLKDLSGNVEDMAAPDGTPREGLELMLLSAADSLEEIGYKAQLVDKFKIRVYGGLFDGKFYPATKGIVESKTLKKADLPTVKAPPNG
jgi:hypothetical protein